MAPQASESHMEYEPVIGLETHIQLSTSSKIFCSSSTKFGSAPNRHIDPVTLGLPGSLPVLNRSVVEFAIMIGLATACEIRRTSRFARKHYFYPDLPKGYQISQYDEPICERGSITIVISEATRTIGIKRIHMEEDAGKNIHDIRSGTSLIDLNRAGVPLLEIVSEPDLRSPAEAGAYLRAIRQLVRHLGISDGNMEEGSFRCDANVSLRPIGSLTFGTRTEVKNLNSFKFVEKAIEYEIGRQLAILQSGGRVIQQTLLFDSDSGTTRPMRGKEESADYRYFPDPDLPPVVVDDSWIAQVRANLPKLPHELVAMLVTTHGLTEYDASVLTSERSIYSFFEEAFAISNNAKLTSNWITSELFGYLNKASKSIEESPISASQLGDLVKLVQDGVLSGKMAKTVFEEMFESGRSASDIVQEQGLQQLTNEEEITRIIRQIFEKNPVQLSQFLGGQEKLLGFFVGQVMKVTKGTANPQVVNDLIKREAQSRDS